MGQTPACAQIDLCPHLLPAETIPGSFAAPLNCCPQKQHLAANTRMRNVTLRMAVSQYSFTLRKYRSRDEGRSRGRGRSTQRNETREPSRISSSHGNLGRYASSFKRYTERPEKRHGRTHNTCSFNDPNLVAQAGRQNTGTDSSGLVCITIPSAQGLHSSARATPSLVTTSAGRLPCRTEMGGFVGQSIYSADNPR